MNNFMAQIGKFLISVFGNERQKTVSNIHRDVPKDVLGEVLHKTSSVAEGFLSNANDGKISTKSLRNPRGKRMRSEHTGTVYPLEKDCASFYGTPGYESNLVRITLPYPMYLAWDTNVKIRSLKCHKLVADDLLGIFQDTLEHYGIDRIKQLKLDEYGGCFNKRRMRGGTKWSTHAWGIAVDLKTTTNRLRQKFPIATLSRDEFRPFWRIVKAHGAYSLGVNHDYDWQHFQFCAR